MGRDSEERKVMGGRERGRGDYEQIEEGEEGRDEAGTRLWRNKRGQKGRRRNHKIKRRMREKGGRQRGKEKKRKDRNGGRGRGEKQV